jgi:hypothetical protein
VAVSKSEPLPEDGHVRPRYVADDCNFNVILNGGKIANKVALKMEVHV